MTEASASDLEIRGSLAPKIPLYRSLTDIIVLVHVQQVIIMLICLFACL